MILYDMKIYYTYYCRIDYINEEIFCTPAPLQRKVSSTSFPATNTVFTALFQETDS